MPLRRSRQHKGSTKKRAPLMLPGSTSRNPAWLTCGRMLVVITLWTSPVSVEMVQKTAVIRQPVIIAISAPTALAVRTAEQSKVTLIAVARGTSSEVFTHSWRLSLK
jgi:FdhD protein